MNSRTIKAVDLLLSISAFCIVFGSTLIFIREEEEQVQEEENIQDTIKALEKSHLPAKGKYSQGDTEESVVRDLKPTVTRQYVEVKLGFDKTRPGAGGFLITGTPKMQPDRALAQIYGSRKYQTDITNQIKEDLDKAIKERMKS